MPNDDGNSDADADADVDVDVADDTVLVEEVRIGGSNSIIIRFGCVHRNYVCACLCI